jgi:hypothetical protein
MGHRGNARRQAHRREGDQDQLFHKMHLLCRLARGDRASRSVHFFRKEPAVTDRVTNSLRNGGADKPVVCSAQ